MPKLSGVFEQFRGLDQIPIADVARWLKNKDDTHLLDNFIANRIIYPQTLPLTKIELEIDLAIFREAIKKEPRVLYDLEQKRINLSDEFIYRFGSVENLLTALIEALGINGLNYIFLKKAQGNELIGSMVTPESIPNGVIVSTLINNQNLGLKNGEMHILPFKDSKLDVKIESSKEVLAAGGNLGLIIDLTKGVSTTL